MLVYWGPKKKNHKKIQQTSNLNWIENMVIFQYIEPELVHINDPDVELSSEFSESLSPLPQGSLSGTFTFTEMSFLNNLFGMLTTILL